VATLLVVVGTTASWGASAAVARADAEKSRREFDASSADFASTLKLALQHEEHHPGPRPRASITAEGVETASQADILNQLGCDKDQSFLFCRPQPPSTLLDTLLRTLALEPPRMTAQVTGSPT
jgi:hypothetical protein